MLNTLKLTHSAHHCCTGTCRFILESFGVKVHQDDSKYTMSKDEGYKRVREYTSINHETLKSLFIEFQVTPVQVSSVLTG